MSDKYLEKIALNALAARTMAKEVGILPSSHSAWKYALRNLRDGQGAALQGKALSKGRAKLGDLSNNAYQATKSWDKAYGGRGTEVASRVGITGKIESPMQVGEQMGVTFQKGDNLHTHPSFGKKDILRNTDPRNLKSFERAGPSGLEKHVTKDRYRDLDKHEKIEASLETMRKTVRGEGRRFSPEEGGKYLKLMEGTLPLSSKYPGGIHPRADIGGNLERGTPLERTSSPSVNATSAYKLTKNGPRVVYFDHTPRKAKT